MLSRRWQAESKLGGIFMGFLSLNVETESFLKLISDICFVFNLILFTYIFFYFRATGSLHIYHGFQISVFMGILSVQMSGSVSGTLSESLFLLFVLSNIGVVVFFVMFYSTNKKIKLNDV